MLLPAFLALASTPAFTAPVGATSQKSDMQCPALEELPSAMESGLWHIRINQRKNVPIADVRHLITEPGFAWREVSYSLYGAKPPKGQFSVEGLTCAYRRTIDLGPERAGKLIARRTRQTDVYATLDSRFLATFDAASLAPVWRLSQYTLIADYVQTAEEAYPRMSTSYGYQISCFESIQQCRFEVVENARP